MTGPAVDGRAGPSRRQGCLVSTMKDFLTAIALALTFEGVLYALFPAVMKRMMARLLSHPDNALRWAGLIATIVGVALVAVIRRAAFA